MEEGRLDGWKGISEYLNRDIRTCQRWEKELGLPVHRINRFSLRSKIFAYKSELDHWLENRFVASEDEKPILTRKIRLPNYILAISLSIVTIILVFSAILLWKESKSTKLESSDFNPSRWELKGQYLVFYDLKDRYLWDVKIDNPVSQLDYYEDLEIRDKERKLVVSRNRSRIDMSDTDNDGMNEVICFLNHKNPEKRHITFFDNNGEVIWTNSVSFEQEYKGGGIVRDYAVVQLELQDINNDGKEEVLVLWEHIRRFPGIFAIYDLRGEELFRYCHTGRLHCFKVLFLEGSNKEIFVGGTNNLLDGDGVLAVLDCRRLKSGLAPPYDVPLDLKHKKYELEIYCPRDYIPACQNRYIRFRKNEMCKLEKVEWLFVDEIRADKNWINVKATLKSVRNCSLYYKFDEGFNIKYVHPSAQLKRDYRDFFKKGKMKIPLSVYLDKCKTDVLYWDGNGWSTVPVKIDN